ncbi:MAG: sensor histidine kinase [Actinomycetes bacterium]
MSDTAVVALAVVALTGLGAAAAALVAARRRERRLLAALAEVVGALSAGERDPDLEHVDPEVRPPLRELIDVHTGIADRLARAAPWRDRLVTTIEGPALTFSSEERLVATNDAARTLLGLGEEAELSVVQALGSPALVGAVREARAGGRPVQVDAEHRGRDLRATASVVGDEVLMIITDRTERRRVEDLRRNFVTNASHELKTPATAIQTLSEALEIALERNPARAPELVARLREESERLVRMVHDLLDLRRLEERGPMERVPVDLSAVVREVVASSQPTAEDRGVAVEVDAPEQAHVAGIAQDLRLVVTNLVTNAVQYNTQGGRVDVHLTRDGGDYLLRVSDTGVGIASQDVARIFERFYRVDAARSRASGGTGLGLSIVRHAVERHGGTVAVESLLGRGSTFTVRLPIDPVD